MSPKESSEILASIVCTAYNHKPYIAYTLRGILAQETDFPFEVIVNDDASPDGTAEVIRSFEGAFGDRMRPLYRQENGWSRGVHPWFDATFPLVRGKYIAVCEGDDYWFDPRKLQRQVEILEADPGLGAVHSDYLEYHQEREAFVHLQRDAMRMEGSILADLLRSNGNYLATGSLVMRTDLVREAVEAIRAMPRFAMGDFPLVLYIAAHARIAYLHEPTCVYRVLGESASHSANPSKVIAFRRSTLEVIEAFARGLPEEHEIVSGAHDFFHELLLMDCLRHPRLAKAHMPELEAAEMSTSLRRKRAFLRVFGGTPVASLVGAFVRHLDARRAENQLAKLVVPAPAWTP